MPEIKEKKHIKAIKTEVYSRIVGYYRPVQSWNKGKREEFSQREYISLTNTREKADS
ncbi:MAG: anaerobic ribonucleoside-triphosphate reductase [Candidatus Aegiribacteria sp.]|nr:anaerobic ribonucleoside-triphosphate reductase [Candidatus Aegiribacteria sp.]